MDLLLLRRDDVPRERSNLIRRQLRQQGLVLGDVAKERLHCQAPSHGKPAEQEGEDLI